MSVGFWQRSVTSCGNIGNNPVGLAAAPDGTLITQSQQTGEVYSVNPSNGALTDIGPSGFTGQVGLGSTTTTLYNLTPDGSVYSINPTTGAAAKIGNAGVAIGTYVNIGVSTGSKALYLRTGTN